jgi:hypothetical protein
MTYRQPAQAARASQLTYGHNKVNRPSLLQKSSDGFQKLGQNILQGVQNKAASMANIVLDSEIAQKQKQEDYLVMY